MDNPNLYPLTNAIIERCSEAFVKVDAHNEDDPESVDCLWTEYTPDHELTEGELLTVGPFVPGGDLWSVSKESAHKFGGWATSWDMTGTVKEILDAIT